MVVGDLIGEYSVLGASDLPFNYLVYGTQGRERTYEGWFDAEDSQSKFRGCFRTDRGIDDFAKLYSIVEIAMKIGNSKFNAILAVVE